MLILFCGFPSVHLSNHWIKQFSALFTIIYWSFPFSILRIDCIFSHFSRCFPSPLWQPFRPAPSVGASTAAGQVGLQVLRGKKGVVLDLFKDQFLVRNGCLNVERFQDFVWSCGYSHSYTNHAGFCSPNFLVLLVGEHFYGQANSRTSWESGYSCWGRLGWEWCARCQLLDDFQTHDIKGLIEPACTRNVDGSSSWRVALHTGWVVPVVPVLCVDGIPLSQGHKSWSSGFCSPETCQVKISATVKWNQFEGLGVYQTLNFWLNIMNNSSTHKFIPRWYGE